jgi:hypothetical protein
MFPLQELERAVVEQRFAGAIECWTLSCLHAAGVLDDALSSMDPEELDETIGMKFFEVIGMPEVLGICGEWTEMHWYRDGEWWFDSSEERSGEESFPYDSWNKLVCRKHAFRVWPPEER